MYNLFDSITYFLFHIGLNLLKFFNIAKITLSKQCTYLYNNVDFVKTNVDSTMRFYYYNIKIKLVKHRLEPFDNTWTGLFYIKNGVYEENGYVLTDYDNLDDPSEMSQLASDFYGSYKFANNTLSEEIPEYLVLLKSPHFWLSRICNDSVKDSDISLTSTPKYFLSVEYSHPCMENKINIEIDPLLYLDKNELFSYIFVLRCLEYQPVPYVFDSEYKLHIMDNEIKMFELHSNEYIKLNKSDYTIITSDANTIKNDEEDEDEDEEDEDEDDDEDEEDEDEAEDEDEDDEDDEDEHDKSILNKLNRALAKVMNIDDEDDYEIFEDELMK